MIKIMRLSDVNTEDILIRSTSSDDVSATVAAIIEDVRKGGDSVLFEYTKRFDGVLLEDIAVSEKEIDDAFKKMVIVGERMKLRRDDFGIVMTGIYEFLFDPKIIDA